MTLFSCRKSNTDDIDALLEDSDGEPDDEDDKTMKRPNKRFKAKAFIDEGEEDDGEVLDLLSAEANRMIVSTLPVKSKTKSVLDSNDDTITIDKDGMIVVNDTKGTKRKIDDEDEDDKQMEVGSTYKPGGKGIHRQTSTISQRKAKRDNRSKSLPGEEYTSKKASGDMKRKGKPDPFAYMPLNRKSLNKRHGGKNKDQFSNLIKAAKKGAATKRHKTVKNKNKKHK